MYNHPFCLKALATANPPLYVTQEQAFHYYRTLFDLQEHEEELYRRLLLDGAIEGRYIGMDSPVEAVETDQDLLNRRYLKFSRMIAARAVEKALVRAGCSPSAVGGLVVNSCTGYLCPGLTSYLVEDAGLPRDLQIADLMGMGCGGALPGLSVAGGMIRARPRKLVLSIAVEVCTATIFMGQDPGLIVSNSIFGDGASAAVLAAEEGDGSMLLRFIDFEYNIAPEHRAELQYRTENHRLRNVLTTRVPAIGAAAIRQAAGRLMARHGLSLNDIRHWAVHPGGTTVLKGIARKFGLEHDQLRYSHEVFRQYGNMSSPTVMFVLQRILEHERPQPGEYGLLLAFGAGFSAFAALVRF